MAAKKLLDIDEFMSELREEILGRANASSAVDPEMQRKLVDQAIGRLRLANRARESLPAKLDILPLSGFNRALLGVWERSTRSRRRFNEGILAVLALLQTFAESQGREARQEVLALRRENLDLLQRLEGLERQLGSQAQS